MYTNLVSVAIPTVIIGLIIHFAYKLVRSRWAYSGITLLESALILLASVPGFGGCGSGSGGFGLPLPLILGLPADILFSFSPSCEWVHTLTYDYSYVSTIFNSYFFAWLGPNILFISLLYLLKAKRLSIVSSLAVYLIVVSGVFAYRFYVMPLLVDDSKDQELAKNILGTWVKKNVYRLGILSPGYNRPFFLRGGKELSSGAKSIGNHTVSDNQLIMDKGSVVYNIVSVSETILIIESISGNIDETFIYERADLIIDNDWVAKKLFKEHSCTFHYFNENGEYTSVSTSSCPIENGTDKIHIKEDKDRLRFRIEYGEWWIDSNVVHSESIVVQHHMYEIIGKKSSREFNTEISHPNSLNRYTLLKQNEFPEYSVLHKIAKETYKCHMGNNPDQLSKNNPRVNSGYDIDSYKIRLKTFQEKNESYQAALNKRFSDKSLKHKNTEFNGSTIEAIRRIVELYRLEDEIKITTILANKYDAITSQLSKNKICGPHAYIEDIPGYLIRIKFEYPKTINWDRFTKIDIDKNNITYDDIVLFQNITPQDGKCLRSAKERKLYRDLGAVVRKKLRKESQKISDIRKKNKLLINSLKTQMREHITSNKTLYREENKELLRLKEENKQLYDQRSKINETRVSIYMDGKNVECRFPDGLRPLVSNNEYWEKIIE